MTNIEKLINYFNRLGWFTGKAELIFKIENEFEGFYGKASEDWEKRASIEIIGIYDHQLKSFKIVGKRFETLDDVALQVLNEIAKHVEG